MSWDQTDRLVVERDGVVADRLGRSTRLVRTGLRGAPGDADRRQRPRRGHADRPGASRVQDGARFLATTADDADAGDMLGLDGRFTATNDLPPVYQRTGRERPVGAAAHGVGIGVRQRTRRSQRGLLPHRVRRET